MKSATDMFLERLLVTKRSTMVCLSADSWHCGIVGFRKVQIMGMGQVWCLHRSPPCFCLGIFSFCSEHGNSLREFSVLIQCMNVHLKEKKSKIKQPLVKDNGVTLKVLRKSECIK